MLKVLIVTVASYFKFPINLKTDIINTDMFVSKVQILSFAKNIISIYLFNLNR